MKNQLLKFGRGNKKLAGYITTFSLPAGHTCPQALECQSKAPKNGVGKIQDGPNCQFRCFAASQERMYPNVRKARWYNLNLLKRLSIESMVDLIEWSIPKSLYVRIHVSGDFYNQKYFLAWCEVAKRNPRTIFYAYTKSISLWQDNLEFVPNNLRLTASLGGKEDNLALELGLKTAYVVFSKAQAKAMNLEIDYDDSLAYSESNESFALLLHGTQPKGSEASKALSEIKKQKRLELV